MRKKLPILIGALLLGAGYLSGCTERSDTTMTADAQTPDAQTADRVFEMRTYTAYPGKLEDLHSRFRDHTTRLFEKHGMTNIGYWVPQDPERSQNTIIYILAYPSREFATEAWDAFRADPEWVAAKAASEEDGLLVERVESVFMDPVDYSKIK